MINVSRITSRNEVHGRTRKAESEKDWRKEGIKTDKRRKKNRSCQKELGKHMKRDYKISWDRREEGEQR